MDYIGKKFNKLTIVSFSRKTKNGMIYNCMCDCGRGTTIECNIKKLLNGKTIDCGCSKRLNDLTNKKFGKLLVVKRYFKENNKSKNSFWLCKCECGNERIVRNDFLKKNIITHCGCDDKKNKISQENRHLYKVWRDIKDRCKRNKNYYDNNIKVSEEWQGKNGFYNFCKWSYENGYNNKKNDKGYNILTIDRINVNGNYEPSNCRWITMLEQQYNKRTTIYVEYKGKKYNFLQLEKLFNKPRKWIYKMYKKGYIISEIKNMQVEKTIKKKINIDYSQYLDKNLFPCVLFTNKYNISERKIRYFLEKNKLKITKLKKRKCINIEDLPIFENHFKIKVNLDFCKTFETPQS